MHNTMYPGSAKFQARPASPQFANFSPPTDYPHTAGVVSGGSSLHQLPPLHPHHHTHQHQFQHQQQHHQHQQQHLQSHTQSMSMRHPKTLASSKSSRSVNMHGHANASAHMINSNTMAAGALLGNVGHHRSDLILPDDMESIEFCMSAAAAAAPTNGHNNHGMNSEHLLLHGSNNANNGLCSNGESAAFTERRRRSHNRRSNHKIDVEQQVKWSRKNIAATMERFEPTTHSSSSASSLEYGFAAGVVTPSSTPLHQPQHSPTHHQQQASYPLGQSAMGGAAANAIGPMSHVYSYAYYEPGAAKCHTNVPYKDASAIVPAPLAMASTSKSPPRNSIRALLAKGFRSKSSNSGQSTSSSPSTDERHTYTTRYGTTENLYEEVNEQKIRKVLSDNRIASTGVPNVKEELRRVQHNHFRVLDELNLSLEALIMPPTPPDNSPNQGDDDGTTATNTNAAAAAVAPCAAASSSSTISAAATAPRPRRGGLLGGASTSASSTSSQQRILSHVSLENLSTTLNSIELKDHAHNSCINPEFDEGDLDSGFSGSGSSSGASYNESLRYYKTGTPHALDASHASAQQLQTPIMQHNLRSCRSSTASGTSTSKSSMASSEDQGIGMMTGLSGGCGAAAVLGGNGAVNGNGNGILAAAMSPFTYTRRCSDVQRSSGRSASACSATGTKPKKNFWTIKP